MPGPDNTNTPQPEKGSADQRGPRVEPEAAELTPYDSPLAEESTEDQNGRLVAMLANDDIPPTVVERRRRDLGLGYEPPDDPATIERHLHRKAALELSGQWPEGSTQNDLRGLVGAGYSNVLLGMEAKGTLPDGTVAGILADRSQIPTSLESREYKFEAHGVRRPDADNPLASLLRKKSQA